MKPLALTLSTLALLTAFVVAACDDGDGAPSTTATAAGAAPTATSAGVTPTTPGVTGTGTPPFEGSPGPVEGPTPDGYVGGVTPAPELVDVRTGVHEGYDRITFEFRNDIPGYLIEYVQPPITKDPSDLPVEIAGNAFLRVRFEPAVAHDESSNPTFAQMELTPGDTTLLEAEQIGDFEGVVSWVLGLSEEVDFRVDTLDSPPRIYIDVPHP